MKKTYRSFFCLLAVLLLSISALPAASALFSERLYYYGTVEEISRAADGTVESVLVTAEGQETYEMVITDRTQWQDHDEKTTSDPATLAVGEQICVVHDPAVMMSLPPQSVAYTVIRNFPGRHGSGAGSPRRCLPGEAVLARTRRPLRTGSTRPCPLQSESDCIVKKEKHLLSHAGGCYVRQRGSRCFLCVILSCSTYDSSSWAAVQKHSVPLEPKIAGALKTQLSNVALDQHPIL